MAEESIIWPVYGMKGKTDENSKELSEALLCLVYSISFNIHACVVFKLQAIDKLILYGVQKDCMQ